MALHISGLPSVGPLICTSRFFRAIVDRSDRPTWLVNITNGACFGNSAGPRQHLIAVHLRVVEERFPVVRATSTGGYAIFEAYYHK